MAKNFHVFTSSYGSRRFVVCECWTQVMQEDSDFWWRIATYLQNSLLMWDRTLVRFNLFLWNKVPCLKNLQIVYFLTCRNIPSYCCQRSAFFVTTAVKWSNFFLHRMGKALCECPFALQRQKPEKYKQNIDVSPLERFLRMPVERGLGAILTKVCQLLLNGASTSWG